MIVTRKALPRRIFLRGVGTALALPLPIWASFPVMAAFGIGIGISFGIGFEKLALSVDVLKQAIGIDEGDDSTVSQDGAARKGRG